MKTTQETAGQQTDGQTIAHPAYAVYVGTRPSGVEVWSYDPSTTAQLRADFAARYGR